MKILIVDDKEAFQFTQVMKKLFPDAEIDNADRSETAVEMVRKNQYSFVTMDGDLGVWSSKSGPETIEEIRKFNRSIPIIMLSNSDSWNDLGRKTGANASMNKDLFLRVEKADFKKLLAEIGVIS